MRLIVLDTKSERTENQEDESKEETTEDQEDNQETEPEYQGAKWWLPFRCGKTNTVHTKQGAFGAGCGSRGCLTCHTKKIRKSVNAMKAIRAYPGSTMYAIVFSPGVGRIKSQDDVSNFLASFRRLLRRWQRTHELHFGYWVAECVIKDDEEPTAIPCPIGEYLDEDYTMVEKEAHENCQAGNCPVCNGKGFLPSVHLHIHLVICCRSFWFGRGAVPEDKARYHDFNGLGWWGFCESESLGVSKCQLLKSRNGMAQYISKACLEYIAKVDKTQNSKGEIDWMKSQRGAMVASYIYGRKRHRGACGDLYGLTKKTKDVTNYISVEYAPPIQPGKNITDVFQGEYTPPEKPKSNDGVYIELLGVGLKAQENLNGRIVPNNVLLETELDTKPDTTYTLSLEGFQEAPRFYSRTLSKAWKGCQVVQNRTPWFKIKGTLLVCGIGSTTMSVPRMFYEKGGLEYVAWLLERLLVYDYKHWIWFFHYPETELVA